MILPISMSRVDLKGLKKAIAQALQFSPNSSTQDNTIEFVQVLLQTKTGTYFNRFTALQEAGNLLKHVFFGFVTVCDFESYAALAVETNLALSTLGKNDKDQVFFLISGTLFDFKETIIAGCTIHTHPLLRKFMCEFYTYFDSQGLALIFSEYRRRPIDGTFYLEQKK